MLKLAAGGFRDMTRIASGSPDMWPDVCVQNSDEIVKVISELIEYLNIIKADIESKDKQGLFKKLIEAQSGREALIKSRFKPSKLATIRIAVQDKPGELLEILSVAKSLNVNIEDVQLTHRPIEDGSIDQTGILHLVVDQRDSEKLYDAIADGGHITTLESEIGL